MIEEKARRMLFDGVEAALFVIVFSGVLLVIVGSGLHDVLPMPEGIALGLAVGSVLGLRLVRRSRIPKARAIAHAKSPHQRPRWSVVLLGVGIGLLHATPLFLLVGVGERDPLMMTAAVLLVVVGMALVEAWRRLGRA